MTTLSDLEQLRIDLEAFQPTDQASWTLGRIFNSLLGQAQAERSDNAVLTAIEPAEQFGAASGVPDASTMNVGSMIACVNQIISALGG